MRKTSRGVYVLDITQLRSLIPETNKLEFMMFETFDDMLFHLIEAIEISGKYLFVTDIPKTSHFVVREISQDATELLSKSDAENISEFFKEEIMEANIDKTQQSILSNIDNNLKYNQKLPWEQNF